MRGWLYHQLPVFSPLPPRLLPAALAAAAGVVPDPRPALLRALCDAYSASEGLLCGSGTSALQLAIGIAARSAGSPMVALPAFSCFDVAAAAVGAQARILFYDVDPDTLGPELGSLERALDAGARSVVVNPLYGIPVEWDAVRACCERHGALLIEDAAQSAGAHWRGLPVGSLGALSVLSFGRGKGWTGGAGGALLVRHPLSPPDVDLLVRRAAWRREARLLAGALLQAVLGRPSLYRVPVSIPWLRLGETVYHDAAPAAAMLRSAAALIAASQAAASSEAGFRRRSAGVLLAGIEARASVRPVAAPPGADATFLRLPVRLARGIRGFTDPRQALRLGIAPSYPTPLPELPQVQPQRCTRDAHWPGAAQLARELVTLPTHSRVRREEQTRMLYLVNTYPG